MKLESTGAVIAAPNWAALNFVDWEVAYGDQGFRLINITSFPTVVRRMADDIYLNLQFWQWAPQRGGSVT
jgi:hypothetical protein